jgi:2-polyprenyl-6-hydroxyphenyl methylase/3-demethylubiquinone-9 3-methyltransferase
MPFFKDMKNIDPNEIAKFEALASRWWDPASEFAPLHQINPLRLDYIAGHAALDGRRALDVGCGGGLLSEGLWSRGARVIGIDAGAAPIGVARLHARQSKAEIDYRITTAEDLAQQKEAPFDLICCLEMLEHVPDPAQTVNACAQLLAPGGDLFFSTINRNAKAFLLAIVGAEYLLSLLPRGTHHYEKLIRPSELDQWAREASLHFEAITGMHYNPVSRKYRLGPGVDVNYIVHYSKPIAS